MVSYLTRVCEAREIVVITMPRQPKTEDEIIEELLEHRGIEEREEIHLEQHIDDRQWEARHQDGSGEGDTRTDALEALPHLAIACNSYYTHVVTWGAITSLPEGTVPLVPPVSLQNGYTTILEA